MKYVQLRKDDYDKSLKLDNQLCLCYSAKKLKKVESGNVEILGEVIKGESKKEPSAKLNIENKLISVYDEGTFSKLIYKKAAYIAVKESDGYIVVLENRLPILLWLLGLLIVALIAIVLFMHQPEADTVEPYNALPPVDSNVEMIDEKTPQESSAPQGGGKVGIGYEKTARLSLSTKEIEMEYSNPNVSNQDAVIELWVVSGEKEYIVSASGRIPSGSKLSKMTLSEDAPSLSEGVYDARYKVSYYDSRTGEKALVSSNIENIYLIVK